MFRIKIAGIYKIEHKSGFYYIGMSKDIFSRWSSHYTDIKMKKHSSVDLMRLWNETAPSEWSFCILEYVSINQYKTINPGCTGKILESSFRRHLLSREKYWMGLYSVNYCLNKDKKHFT